MEINHDANFAWDEVRISPTRKFSTILGEFTLIVESGRASIQTYLSREELLAHIDQCREALA